MGRESEFDESGVGDEKEVLVTALADGAGKMIEGVLAEVDDGGVVELLHCS